MFLLFLLRHHDGCPFQCEYSLKGAGCREVRKEDSGNTAPARVMCSPSIQRTQSLRLRHTAQLNRLFRRRVNDSVRTVRGADYHSHHAISESGFMTDRSLRKRRAPGAGMSPISLGASCLSALPAGQRGGIRAGGESLRPTSRSRLSQTRPAGAGRPTQARAKHPSPGPT